MTKIVSRKFMVIPSTLDPMVGASMIEEYVHDYDYDVENMVAVNQNLYVYLVKRMDVDEQ